MQGDFFFCLVEIKVISVTWEHLLDNFMQPIYDGFLRPSYTTGYQRTPQDKSVCHAIKMMSDDDTDDCDGLFDHLFYVALRLLRRVMKIFSLYSIFVCTVELVQQVQLDVVLIEYETFCKKHYFRNDTQIMDCFKLLQDNEAGFMYKSYIKRRSIYILVLVYIVNIIQSKVERYHLKQE